MLSTTGLQPTTMFPRRRVGSADLPIERSDSLLSRSLGNGTLEIQRRSSECACITHSGYLFKRSNKPFRTAATTAPPTTQQQKPSVAAAAAALAAAASSAATQRPIPDGGFDSVVPSAATVPTSCSDGTQTAAAPQHLLRGEGSGSGSVPDLVEEEESTTRTTVTTPERTAIDMAADFFGCDPAEEDRHGGGEDEDGAGSTAGWWWSGKMRRGRTVAASTDNDSNIERLKNIDGGGSGGRRSGSTTPRTNGATALPVSTRQSQPIPISPRLAVSSPLVAATVSGGRIPIPIAPRQQRGPAAMSPPFPTDPTNFHRFDSAPATVWSGNEHSSSGNYGRVATNGDIGGGTDADGRLTRRQPSDEAALGEGSSHSGGIHPPPPPDFIDPVDGHIWRAKYCVMEDGVLYFYRNAVVGESMEAQVEREQMSLFHALGGDGGNGSEGGPQDGMGGDGGELRTRGIVGGGSGGGGRTNEDLSRSPVPGGVHHLLAAATMAATGVTSPQSELQATGSSFCCDARVIWEKRVALDCVGEVRSAELDYGERSFELLAIEESEDGPKDADDDDEDEESESDSDRPDSCDRETDVEAAPKKAEKPRMEDRLILRAGSAEEMNEWLFQIHRSLASFMKEIVDLVGASARVPADRPVDSQWILSPEPLSVGPRPPLVSGLHPPLVEAAGGAPVPIPEPVGGAAAAPSIEKPTGVVRSYSPGGALRGGGGDPSSSPNTVLSHGHGRSGQHRQRIRSIKHEQQGRLSLASLVSPSSTPGGGSSPVMSKSLGEAGILAAMSVDRSRVRGKKMQTLLRGDDFETAVQRGLNRLQRGTEKGSEKSRLVPPPPLTGGRAPDADKDGGEEEKEKGGIGALVAGPPQPPREAKLDVSCEKRTKPAVETELARPEPPFPAAAKAKASQAKPKPNPKPMGKYVPPHLRNKGGGGGGKYVPPHLRNRGSCPPPPPPPPPCEPPERLWANGGSVVAAVAAPKDELGPSGDALFELTVDDDAQFVEKKDEEEVPFSMSRSDGFGIVGNEEEEEEKDETTGGGSDNAAGAAAPVHFNRGGCADPEVAIGSILEAMFVDRKASKIGKFHTDGYGAVGGRKVEGDARNSCEGTKAGVGTAASADGDGERRALKRLRWEVGAISQCGVRESNEDSYLISNDLFAAFEAYCSSLSDNEGDVEGPEKNFCDVFGKLDVGDMDHHGLFAIFDGHCGNQAARYAAEKLPFYLMNEYKASPCSSAMSADERAERVLLGAIARLDEEFCHLCQADGREWDCGATALVVLVIGDTVVVANLGDSRGVLCKSLVSVGNINSSRHDSGSGAVAHPEDVSEENGWEILEVDEEGAGAVNSNPPSVYFRVVTPIHNPGRPDEKRRIEAANGWITTETEIPIKIQLQRMDFFDPDVVDILKRCFADRLKDNNTHEPKKCSAAEPGRMLQISRTCGELAVSRAIGDRDFKAAFNAPSAADINDEKEDDDAVSESRLWECPFLLPFPDNHCMRFDGDLISGIPEIQAMRVGGDNILEEFLLLACDGLWDVMDADDAVRVTRGLLFDKQWSAKKAAARLAELAIHLGSSDNITVIVIRFFVEG